MYKKFQKAIGVIEALGITFMAAELSMIVMALHDPEFINVTIDKKNKEENKDGHQ